MDGLNGTLKVFRKPCEEGYVENAGGKIPILEARLFEGVDIMLVDHALDMYGPATSTWSRGHFKIIFRVGILKAGLGTRRSAPLIRCY